VYIRYITNPIKAMNCSGKKCYTKNEISHVRKAIYRDRTKRLRAYQCPQCFMWHLTSVLDNTSQHKKKPTVYRKYGQHI